MNTPTVKKVSDGLDILRNLHCQFSQNFISALKTKVPEIERVELKSRCLASIGELLRNNSAASETQKQITTIYDEVFADSVCSIYLAAQGLDKPAQLVLRRVLELGLAAVYLWDQPHLFWGWKEYDQDLSFTEITAYLSSPSYLSFVKSEIGTPEPNPLFDVTLARNEYRALSNAVHGKFNTFESPLVDRFKHSDDDWKNHLLRLESIQDLLLNLTRARYVDVKEKLHLVQPQIVTLS